MSIKTNTAIAFIILMMAGCKEKVTEPPKAEVQSLPVVNSENYSKYLLSRIQQPKPPVQPTPPQTPPVEPPVPPIVQSNITNPIHENPILIQIFQTYIGSGIDDSEMDGMLDKLKDDDLSDEDFKAIMQQFHRVLFNRNEKFASMLTIEERMKLIFQLYADNKNAAEYIKSTLVPADILKSFSDQEKTIIAPIAFASIVYGIFKQISTPTPEAYSSIDARDGKKYRTISLARIDFSKGISKKTLDPKDLEIIESVAIVWDGLQYSSYRPNELCDNPDGICNFLIGFADRDTPKNAEKNMAVGLVRAQLVYDTFSKIKTPNIFLPKSMGDAYPFVINPKDKANRRVEFIIMHKKVPAE